MYIHVVRRVTGAGFSSCQHLHHCCCYCVMNILVTIIEMCIIYIYIYRERESEIYAYYDYVYCLRTITKLVGDGQTSA